MARPSARRRFVRIPAATPPPPVTVGEERIDTGPPEITGSVRRVSVTRNGGSARPGRSGAPACCSAEGIRTLATAVRGRRPRPLDDGAGPGQSAMAARVAAQGVPAQRRPWNADSPRPGRSGALVRCSPEGIRTLATAVRGRRPGPLDDGAVQCCGGPASQDRCFLAGVPGLEPRLTEPETVGLPITPYPMGGTSRRRRRRYPTTLGPVAPPPTRRVTAPAPGPAPCAAADRPRPCASRAAADGGTVPRRRHTRPWTP